MPKRIDWTGILQLPGESARTMSRSLEVEAIEEIEVVVPSGVDAPKEVEVQPSPLEQVKILVLTSDRSEGVSYRIGAKDAKTQIPLDQPQVFFGEGLLGLLPADPKVLFFSNESGEDAKVSIVVGRTAAP